MCIGFNSVNDAQDLMAVKNFRDFQNSLIPNVGLVGIKLVAGRHNQIILAQKKLSEILIPLLPPQLHCILNVL